VEISAWLPTHASLQERTYDTGHSITEVELADVSLFIEAQFPR
jgi:predicted esterase